MLSFMKVPPTTYVLQYKHGKIKREGAGLSFFYWTPTSTIVAVPLASADVPFVFPETTADFQSVTIQGQLTYRVADPKRLACLLDFTIDKRNTSYFEDHSRDRQKLSPAWDWKFWPCLSWTSNPLQKCRGHLRRRRARRFRDARTKQSTPAATPPSKTNG